MLWSQILTVGIVLTNAAVWVMWNIPKIQKTMIKYFTAGPGRFLSSYHLIPD